MQTALYVVASFLPLLLLILCWLLTKKWRSSSRLVLILSELIASAPIGIFAVAQTSGIDFAIHHNPGLGMIFMPLMAVWVASAGIAFGWLTFEILKWRATEA